MYNYADRNPSPNPNRNPNAGQVEKRTMNKYAHEAGQVGKASFRFAWVLDQGEEERARGVTIDVVPDFDRNHQPWATCAAHAHQPCA